MIAASQQNVLLKIMKENQKHLELENTKLFFLNKPNNDPENLDNFRPLTPHCTVCHWQLKHSSLVNWLLPDHFVNSKRERGK